jgi:hypothetical protein
MIFRGGRHRDHGEDELPVTCRGEQMNYWSIRVAAPLFAGAMFGFAAMAARLPTSTLDVRFLSVDQESFRRDPSSALSGQSFETTGYVARVQIQNVISTAHGLTAGQTIEVHYTIRKAGALPLRSKSQPPKPGESRTINVMKAKSGYEWRR